MSSAVLALVHSWSFPPWASFALLLTGTIYLRGWITLRPLMPAYFPTWRLAAFQAGLAVLWFAIASPLDAFANLLLTAHMMQHLLFMVVAPPLILLGAPAIPLLRGLPLWATRDALGPFLSWPLLQRFGYGLTHPAICWLLMAVAMLGWHTPAAYDLALRSSAWHQVEHACFFATSLLFWWPAIQPWPSLPRWPGWTIPLYLLFGDIVNSVLSAFLAFSDRILYPTYATGPRLFNLSALDDQVMAGAIMWVVGSFVFLGAAAVITVRLLSPSAAVLQSEALPVLRPVSSQPARRPFDLLHVPLVGSLLRSRYGRRALQAVLLLMALAVVADGFFGNTMAPMNMAGVMPWTYGRAFAILALMVAGNFFCMACPFMLPRELGKRLGFATRRWPRLLRSKWLAVFLLVLFFWSYEAFAVWNRPFLTAWIVGAYFATAFSVDTFYRGASFCKYVCPIGQFHFVSSLVSPLEVKVRSHAVCNTCTTHDCLRGNDRQRGCELDLFLPRKAGSMDCTFCLDCVKACPHDNIGILAQAPAQQLVGDPVRSSVARFSLRPDIAALALVVVFSAFASAVAMVIPFRGWQDFLVAYFPHASFLTGISLLFLLALVLCLVLLLGAAMLAGRSAGSGGKPVRRLWCRLSLALLPLGLAMWSSHVLFHLLTGWNSAWPVVQRIAMDFGSGWVGQPHWVMSSPMLSANTLLAAQVLLLDAGLLLSLYIGWQIASACAPRVRDAMQLIVPWAAVTVAMYASGVWILLQPMQMRGMVQ